ncbi:glycosyltransferase [Agromyces sp. Leaf222]|uniref:glycosyltransferase n=1 Tax=Agromyces sp. Leaf222 TaxID=1735688 RepID=UPI0006FA8B02|nr:glycosyltransferase [Agromyces sp. Leaf222]KQM84117.1 hypothetical protein ASE68_13665 [Agromyces sp. Leaf222]
MITDHEQTVHGVRALRWAPSGPAGSSVPANFGDLLGPMILRRILETRHADARLDPVRGRRVLSVGSVLHLSEPGDVVWGSGVNGKIADQPLNPSLDVRAVRGPLTRALLAARGIAAPELFGDPALLIGALWPEFTVPRPTRRAVVAVPNLNELDRFAPEVTRTPLGDPLGVIADLASTAFVTGTSLHALIVADALGIPSRPIAPVAEDAFKYLDHYAGTGRADVRFARSVEEALDLGPVPLPEWDAAALIDAFPLDVWTGDPAPAPAGPRTFVDLRADAFQRRRDLRARFGADASPEASAALDRLDELADRDLPFTGLTREESATVAADAARSRPARREHATGHPREDARDEASSRSGGTADGSAPPLLSVVIPAHDVRPWIGETIASVLAQDLESMEVIVVDDHSTDGTRAVLADLEASDPRVTVIDAVTRGGGTARNIGVDHARGRYLVFCDGDDLVPAGAYRALVASLEATGSDIAFGDYLKFSPTETWRPTANWPAYAGPRRGIRLGDEPSLIFGRPCWNKAFRREFWDRTGARFPDVLRSNDIVPMVTTYLAAGGIDVVEDVVYLYRERPGASSMTAKAASFPAVASYLRQELACARMVQDAGDDDVRDHYATLVLDRDGWVHLSKYLRSADRDPADDGELVALVRELVALVGSEPPTPWSPPRRAVFELVLEGSCDLAAAVAVLFSGPEPESDVRLAAWRRILDAHRDDVVPLLEEGMFRGRFVDALSDVVLLGSPEDHRSLIDLAGAVPREYRALLLAIPELAPAAQDPTGSAAGLEGILAGRLAESRRLAPTLTRVETGTSIRTRIVATAGSGTGEKRFEPVMYDEGTGAVYAMQVDHESSGTEIAWNGTAAPRSLPKHVYLRPALRSARTDDVVSVRVDAVTPEYDPFDGFLLRFDRRGLRLARRSHWVGRAARRATLGVQRRLQRFVPFRRRELGE